MSRSMLSQVIADLEPSATEEVDNAVKRMRQKGVDDIVSLGVGEPCFDTPDNIKKAPCDALWAGETKYQPTAGSYELREKGGGQIYRSSPGRYKKQQSAFPHRHFAPEVSEPQQSAWHHKNWCFLRLAS
jgi:aspartate aminotransferase